jgi:hypothetical protein
MSRALDNYYIEDCGFIMAPEVTQRMIDKSYQFVILATVRGSFCVGLPLIIFANPHTYLFV